MGNVTFDKEQYSHTNTSGQKPSKMAAALIRTGLVTDEKGANIVLIGLIILLAIIFSTTVFLGGGAGSPSQTDSVPDLDSYPEMEV
jgi:hypothetical protein